MPTISRSALVMHSAKEMYQLINDVLSYPQFVPDCGDSKILEQSDKFMTAALLVKKGGMSKWFTTQNTLIEDEQVILTLIDGPFKFLKGSWLLTPLSEEACKIHFELDYEFSNKVLALAFGSVFNHLTNNIVQAFTQRAKEVYITNV
jgi:ribosome-associated toxin RatA of RatAB toxin-antitoxin module